MNEDKRERQGYKLAREDQTNVLKRQARKAQEDLELFGENNVYKTFIDPFARIWQKEKLYGIETALRYKNEDHRNVQGNFEENSFYNEKHIMDLPSMTMGNYQDVLVITNVPIQRQSEL